MKMVFEDDLLHQTASSNVEKTAANLEKAGYKVQANPREINLFYLEGDKRERIEKRNDHFILIDSQRSFTQEQLLNELIEYPERFSPNVILRGLYQETILPNIAFIGGGGELAYWMQLKDLFEHYKVPFPVLILRNSFLIAEKKWNTMVRKLGFTLEDLFNNEQELMNEFVRRESKHPVQLNGAIVELQQLYDSFKQQASTIDPTLEIHVEALKKGVLHRLQELEKKMLRAERRKFSDQQRQLHTISGQLFPNKGLQERRENLSYYYSKWGREFIQAIYNASLGLEQEFVLLVEE
jgi:bacillithiol biosynthesis cysteine-adding enzyme BshC